MSEDTKDIWAAELPSELAFWDRWLGSDEPSERAAREEWLRAGERWLPRVFARGVSDPDRESIRILDVGAGPLTTLGTLLLGRKVELVPVDPLARDYDRLLAKHQIIPPVRTIAGEGERLVEQFGVASFHAAHCANALDHCHSPIRVLEQMVAVVKPGGLVSVLCMDNVGEMERYHGLHQWNVTIREDRPVIWRADGVIDIRDHFSDSAEVDGRLNEQGLVAFEILLRR